MTAVPELSICLVNHRTPELLRDCLNSIRATALDLPIEVLVVNNTLDDVDAIETLRQQFPAVQWFQNNRPLGFAANQNQLMRQAAGRYLMPLNSDTVIRPGTFQELVMFMDQHPRCGMAGPKLVRPDGQLQPSCRNFPNALTHFLESSGLWRLLKHNRLIGRRYYICDPHEMIRTVDWLTGACLIVRREAAQQVGYFNADLFPIMYGEDLEWCWRLQHARWLILFDPNAAIIHLENQSPLDQRTVRMYEGIYVFCANCYPRWKQISIRAATVLALFPRWLLARRATSRTAYAAIMRLSVNRFDRSKARYAEDDNYAK